MGGWSRACLHLLPLLWLFAGVSGQRVTCNLKCPGAVYDPLCASNLHTYGNACEMGIDKCLRKLDDVVMLHKGPCKICSTVGGSCRCPVDQTNTPQYGCPFSARKVCATNGVTYGNECLLNLANLCTPDTLIDIRTEGQCPVIQCGVGCPSTNNPDPVCGSDRQNYSTSCQLELARKCTPGLHNLTRLHGGMCDCASDSNCPPVHSPVCTTQGVTYTSRCVLNVEILCTGQDISIQHNGVCKCGTTYNCPPESNPVCGTNGMTYTNECHLNQVTLCAPAVILASHGRCRDECSATCNSVENSVHVCASNFKTYASMCHFNIANCNTNHNLTIIKNGDCTCGMSHVCTADVRPLCGTDGVTYSNICKFSLAKLCKSTINIAYYGNCRCNITCDPMENKVSVCGSDFNTYPNRCTLNAFGCNSGLNLTVLHTGRCVCGAGYQCTKEQKPVCGTNGVTYNNHCLLRLANLCIPGISLAGIGSCYCNYNCSQVSRPVCASNFKTFANRCVFNMKKCQSGNDLSVLYEGVCTCTGNYRCSIASKPVCGTDRVTYGNECLMEVANLCTPGVEIRFAYTGVCINSCDLRCPLSSNRWPVCGSDYKTYRDNCFLNDAICRSGGALRMMHEGRCQCPQGPFCSTQYRPVCSSLGVPFKNECFLNVYNLCADSQVVKRDDSYCSQVRQYPPSSGRAAVVSVIQWIWLLMLSLSTWQFAK